MGIVIQHFGLGELAMEGWGTREKRELGEPRGGGVLDPARKDKSKNPYKQSLVREQPLEEIPPTSCFSSFSGMSTHMAIYAPPHHDQPFCVCLITIMFMKLRS